jgi:hypothetical protein
MIDNSIAVLKAYALEHYDDGGHWIYECYDKGDYVNRLEESNFDVEKAKTLIHKEWELLEMQKRECAWE